MASTTVKYVQFGNKSYRVTEYKWQGPAGSIMTSRKVELLYTIQDLTEKK